MSKIRIKKCLIRYTVKLNLNAFYYKKHFTKYNYFFHKPYIEFKYQLIF